MTKAPAFQFYAADFLADEKVMLMSVCARGIYITLLALQWREGSIPADSKLIAKLCGCDSSAIESHWHELQDCFVSADSEGKRLINLRLEEQRIELDSFKQNRSEAGKKGAKSRWNKDKPQNTEDKSVDSTANGSAITKPLANDSSSSSSSSSKEKDKANALSQKKKIASRLPEDFTVTPEMRIWAAKEAPNVDVDRQLSQFCDHYAAASGKNAVGLDWTAKWRTWMRNAEDWAKSEKTKAPPLKPPVAPADRLADLQQRGFPAIPTVGGSH